MEEGNVRKRKRRWGAGREKGEKEKEEEGDEVKKKRRRLLASMAGVSSAVWPPIWAPQPPTPRLYVSK